MHIQTFTKNINLDASDTFWWAKLSSELHKFKDNVEFIQSEHDNLEIVDFKISASLTIKPVEVKEELDISDLLSGNFSVDL